MIELNLQIYSNKIFLVDSNVDRTYKELLENTNRMYEALQTYMENSIILVQIKDRFKLACTILALGRLESTYLLVNPQWSNCEIETVLKHTSSKIVITDNEELLSLNNKRIKILSPSELLKAKAKQMSPSLIKLMGKVLMCTTGTTGEPKIVARTWKSLFCEVDAVIERLHYTEQDHIFCLAQWTHSLGFVLHLLSGIRVGARLITSSRLCSPSKWVHIMKREEVTIVVGVPTFYSFLVQVSGAKLNIKMGISAGATLPRDIYEKFRINFSAPLLQFYGCTELGAITMQLPECETKFPSLGRPLNNMQIHIVDEQGIPVKQGEQGLICIKGDGLTHEILNKGNFISVEYEYKTGDQGILTEEDSLIVIGRNSQRIKINGLGLHPGEVEKVLQQHPNIMEAVVTAEEDIRRGTILVAYLRKKDKLPSELEIRNFCKQYLSPYKIPHRYIFVKNFERDEKGQVKL